MSHNTRMFAVAFNTGAYYSVHGQRIAAWLRCDERGDADLACLVDFDRAITCCFAARLSSGLDTAADVAAHAMHMYQRGQYNLGVSAELAAIVFSEMQAVLNSGYEAYIQAPDVRVLRGVGLPS